MLFANSKNTRCRQGLARTMFLPSITYIIKPPAFDLFLIDFTHWNKGIICHYSVS